MHFFNPVPVLPLVELVPSLLTAHETVQRAEAFADGDLGKHTVLSKDRAGFVVNALLIPYLLAAIRMVEAGLRQRRGRRHRDGRRLRAPDGPAGADRPDRARHHAAVAHRCTRSSRSRCTRRRRCCCGWSRPGLGRKSGHGFFPYH